MEKTVTFTNWTNEDFSHTWGHEVFNIPAYSTIEIEKGIADTFAYHLAVRELNKEGKEIGCFINDYTAKAFAGVGEVQVNEETPLKNDSDASGEVLEAPKKKAGRPKKVVEEVFEGLEE